MRNWILPVIMSVMVLAPAGAQGRWETAARLDAPRAGLAVVVHEGRVYAAGGSGLTTPRNEFESYDPAYDRWFPENPLPRGLEQFGMASLDGRIYATGGYAPDENGLVGPSAAMWSWSTDTYVWQSEVAMPGSRADFALVPLDGQLYAIGGLVDDQTGYVFDPESREWSNLELPAGVTRRAAATLVVEGRIHVIGGIAGEAVSARHDIFDPETGSWSEGPAGRSPCIRAVCTCSAGSPRTDGPRCKHISPGRRVTRCGQRMPICRLRAPAPRRSFWNGAFS